jgi:hypothetical protein
MDPQCEGPMADEEILLDDDELSLQPTTTDKFMASPHAILYCYEPE